MQQQGWVAPKRMLVIVALCAVAALAGCHSRAGTEGGLYVYTDAQGNLVTLQRPSEQAQQSAPVETLPEQLPTAARAHNAETETAPSEPQESTRESLPQSSTLVGIDDYRPSDEVEAELEARERNRFVMYTDASGQLITQPVDMLSEREAAAAKAPFEVVQDTEFLETYRPILRDCCLHLLESAVDIKAGKERMVQLHNESDRMLGDPAYRAVLFQVDDSVRSLALRAFIRKQHYVAAEMLWLDENGEPLLLIDQPFTRRYPETWYRHGYLEGTFPREEGQHYLVVFLPYAVPREGTDGLTRATEGELVLSGS